MADSVYYLHGIVIGGNLIGQITDHSPGIQSDVVQSFTNGHYEPLFRAIARQKFAFNFTTMAISQMLAIFAADANGTPYCADLSGGNVDLLYKEGRDLSFRKSTGVRVRAARSFLYWETIEATHQEDATMACVLVPTYDGTNPPVVPAGGQSMTGTPAIAERYTLGPIYLNGSASVENEQSFRLESGAQREEAGSKGFVWDTYTGLRQVDPMVTMEFTGPPMAGLAAAGTALSSISCYLRAKSQDGHNAADASASHILCAATNGIVLPENTSGGINDPTSTTIKASLRSPNATTRTLAFTTGTAI